MSTCFQVSQVHRRRASESILRVAKQVHKYNKYEKCEKTFIFVFIGESNLLLWHNDKSSRQLHSWLNKILRKTLSPQHAECSDTKSWITFLSPHLSFVSMLVSVAQVEI